MNPVDSSLNSPASGEIVLPLADPAHLFNAPDVDPASSSPAEVLGVSGVEHLLQLMFMDRKQQRASTLTLILPPGKAIAVDQGALESGLRRHAHCRIEQLRRELRTTYRYGLIVTGLALVLLAICLALSFLFAGERAEDMRPLTRSTFEYGFEIIGWVVLWHPIEVLAFNPLPIRARIRALGALGHLSVNVLPEQPRTSS